MSTDNNGNAKSNPDSNNNPVKDGSKSHLHIEKLTWLADGIFAFSITLLALDIRAPEIPTEQLSTDLPLVLIGLTPRIVSFLVTFWIVALHWVSYQRAFAHIVRNDNGLIYLNLLFLMFIVLLPFPSDLVGRYPSQFISSIIAAAFFSATGFCLGLIWVHASRHHRLIDVKLDEKLIKRLNYRYMGSPIVFTCSMLIFIFAWMLVPWTAPFLGVYWLVILLTYTFLSHRFNA